MTEDTDSHELIFKIFRIKNDAGEWIPALQDIKSHDIDPSWAAGVAYLILDRYLTAIEESKQNNFYEETLYWLDLMIKDNSGSNYIDKININKDIN